MGHKFAASATALAANVIDKIVLADHLLHGAPSLESRRRRSDIGLNVLLNDEDAQPARLLFDGRSLVIRRRTLLAGLRLASWVIFAAIVVMTLGPVSVRPHTPVSANADRFVAYLVLGLCFVLAYPRRVYLVSVALIAAAGGLSGPKTLFQDETDGWRTFYSRLPV